MAVMSSYSPIACLALLAVGCSGKGDLAGKVMYKEKPIVFGTVQVIASDNQPRQCQIAEDGSYSLQDVPTGEVKIAVTSPNPKSIGSNLIKREGVDPKLYGGFDHVKGWFAIPAEFGDVNTSGLGTTVKSGINSFNIELK